MDQLIELYYDKTMKQWICKFFEEKNPQNIGQIIAQKTNLYIQAEVALTFTSTAILV